MIELVVMVCLAATPASCREERLPSSNPTLIGCMIGGQRDVQAWLDDHPKWTLGRWHCEQKRAERAA